jgi:predicted GIY-YIG superfamily endonuclease
MTRPFFAYMLLCADDSYYVGHTDDLEYRIARHHEGAVLGYTTTRRPVRLVWSQEFPTREEALAAELKIKNWSRAKKDALIAGDFAALSQAAKKKDWAGYRRRKKARG